MTTIQSKAGSTPIDLHTTDSGGDGRPVVLIHGWPLSGDSWSAQRTALMEAGYRVITYDRRGFGRSEKPDDGYDYDTMSEDLAAVMEEMDLRDAVIVGFSMGGGEVARYIGRHGSKRLAGAVFASAVPPYLLQTDDNPNGGLGKEDVEGMKDQLRSDRDAFFAGFAENFYTADGDLKVDRGVIDRWREMAAPCSTDAALTCIDAFAMTDFRSDLDKVDVPTLVIHGAADGIVPIEVSGKRTADTVRDSRFVTIDDGPHGVLDSHTDEFNRALLEFLSSL